MWGMVRQGAWLGRVGLFIAMELGIDDVDRLDDALNGYLHQQIRELD
jgi:hypothetical protein